MLQKVFSQRVAEKTRTKLTFSDDWLSACTKRWGVCRFFSHGESRDCSDAAAVPELPKFHETLKSDTVRDSSNADQFGLNYRTVPT